MSKAKEGKPKYNISFRCYYETGHYTTHIQTLELSKIGKWIEAYQFTHPAVCSISIKVWSNGTERKPEPETEEERTLPWENS